MAHLAYRHHSVRGIDRQAAESKAAAFSAPAWATHVAVRFDGSRVEAAAWSDREAAYLDTDPTQCEEGEFVGGFKESYWSFVPVPIGTGEPR